MAKSLGVRQHIMTRRHRAGTRGNSRMGTVYTDDKGRVHGQHGWDGSVEIVLPGSVDWERDAKTLAALIQDSAPVGKPKYRGGGKGDPLQTIEPEILKRDLSLRRGGYKRLVKPQRGFRLEVRNSYALAQDQGAEIPEARPQGYELVDYDGETLLGRRAGKRLRSGSPGSFRFFTYRKAFKLRGQNYIEKGFDRWVKARGHEGLTLRFLRPGETLGG